LQAEDGSQLAESISEINAAYPSEIVKYYSPGYSDTLLNRLDSFEPMAVASA
jgi:hypothetical protein